MKTLFQSLVLIIVASAVLVGGTELYSHSIEPSGFLIMKPGRWAVRRPIPATSTAVYNVNSFGIRGEDPKGSEDIRIIAFDGGTASLFVDADRSWQHILARELGVALGGERVWIGSAGRSGNTTEHHLQHIQYGLNELSDIDIAIVIVGLNDFLTSLAQPEHYASNRLADRKQAATILKEAFEIVPDTSPKPATAWFEKIKIFRHAMQVGGLDASSSTAPVLLRDATAESDLLCRRHQGSVSRSGKGLPDREPGLKVFKMNVRRMVSMLRELNIRPLFVMQPVKWSEEMSRLQCEPEAEHYSIEALQTGLSAYNDVLRGVCAEDGTQCLDLTNVLSRESSGFYDVVSLNEHGNLLMSGSLYEPLLNMLKAGGIKPAFTAAPRFQGTTYSIP